MSVVHVAFLWHQHQPCYKDLLTGAYALPWTRLHAIKDYWSMPLVAEAVEGMRVTINLVPTLVAQVADYAAGTATDRWLDLYRRPADALDEDDALFILDNFFAANRETMIDVHPRYRELLRRRQFGTRSAADVLPNFKTRDLRDLQVWSLLCWFHPFAFGRYAVLDDLVKKDHHFTEDDKAAILEVQQTVLGEVLPAHRRLAEAGVLEVTTSPYYHPILPLLVDMESAREALPNVALPQKRRSVVDDARAQVKKAVEQHAVIFGRPPTGMWPSEGSVSEGIIPLVAEAGIQWLASDEEVLAQSLGRPLRRESTGSVCGDASLLYRPYRVRNNGAAVNIIFRDHCLSDLIGFQYRSGDPRAAAEDFFSRLVHTGKHVGADCLVPVILDGENAWEHYPRQGMDFLKALYERIVKAPETEPVLVSDYLAAHPPTEHLPRLAAGSWINHNFAIWVGHEEDNRAWDYVFTARAFLEERSKGVAPDNGAAQALRTAWESLYIAEGSDWYWWYGGEHSSGQDEEFDRLFRTHLKNVYTVMGETPPPLFDVPVISAERLTAYKPPKSLLDVRVVGYDSNFFEWLDAGHYQAASRYGAMRHSAGRVVTDLYFGFNEETFFLKLAAHGRLREVLGAAPGVAVTFREPREVTVTCRWSDGGPPAIAVAGPEGGEASSTGVAAALEKTFELGVPFKGLGAEPGDPVQFFVEVTNSAGLSERIPETGTIHFTAPSRDFEQINWQA